jgi:signal transduction histidine kinase
MTCRATDRPVHEKTQMAAEHGEVRQAPAAKATLCQDGQYLAFTAADDGTGLDRAAIPTRTGLQGITGRLAVLSGKHRHHLHPGHGTQVASWIRATTR